MRHLDGLKGVLSLVVVGNHFVHMCYPAMLTHGWMSRHHDWERWVTLYTPLGALYAGEFAVVRPRACVCPCPLHCGEQSGWCHVMS